MASQTFNMSVRTNTSSQIILEPVGTQTINDDLLHTSGQTLEIDRIRFRNNGIFLRLSPSGDNDLSDDWEVSSSAVEITAGSSSWLFRGPGAWGSSETDRTEPYTWVPTTTDLSVFISEFRALSASDRANPTLTLDAPDAIMVVTGLQNSSLAVGTSDHQELSVSGGSLPITWSSVTKDTSILTTTIASTGARTARASYTGVSGGFTTLTVTVTDADNNRARIRSIIFSNAAPTVTPPDIEVSEGRTESGQVIFRGAGTGPSTIRKVPDVNDWITYDQTTGRVTASPPLGTADGDYTYRLEITDQHSQTSRGQGTITVSSGIGFRKRNIDSNLIQPMLGIVRLIELNTSVGPIYFTNAPMSLKWDGKTWESHGGVVHVEDINETSDWRAQRVRLTLSGAGLSIARRVRSEGLRGRVAKVWRARYDFESGAIRGNPYLDFSGLCSSDWQFRHVTDPDQPQSYDIQTDILSRLAVLNVRALYTNVGSHQETLRRAGVTGTALNDRFFEFVPGLEDKELHFGLANIDLTPQIPPLPPDEPE